MVEELEYLWGIIIRFLFKWKNIFGFDLWGYVY